MLQISNTFAPLFKRMACAKRSFQAYLRLKKYPYQSTPIATFVGTTSVVFNDSYEYVTYRDARIPDFSYSTPYSENVRLWDKLNMFQKHVSTLFRAKSIARSFSH
jgi:hypothetical protein